MNPSALPLRTRLAALTAAAVALAVAAIALSAWFLVRGQLLASLDERLQESRIPVNLLERARVTDCMADDSGGPGERGPSPFGDIAQLVDSRGQRCVIFGDIGLEVAAADRAVAADQRASALHTVTGTDGSAYRVLTRHLPGVDAEGLLQGPVALTVARPMDEVNDPLRALALVLAAVAAAGVVGAAGVGVLLARAGLRPVDRLTEAAEHIARTEDLSVRIPAEGDDELARLSRAFNSMTAALASSRELQQQLIADAGHELRTPLTSLRTNVELLTRSETSGRPLAPGVRRELMDSVTAQLGELGTLVGDLQELSRPERSGRAREITGLHEIAQRAAARARLRARGLEISTELDPWYVRAEPAALERAVVNLLDNAVKFGAGGGSVAVTLRDGELRIRDHGPGIPADELPHVWERFWRSPDARGLPGSGLGLSIVARTVRECGGEVGLAPAPGGGTVANLRLPGAPEPPPDGPVPRH
ncbi:sensor histidine kinase [Streptomyces aidingensis]|uniref:histidine kinase n=1 Tax=Streptomyces aidingensis TaxID=910347 RepID=A0A1I1HUQ8_9ACTN|nr:HAMP domain-containing sensor histidine kinase [Streptomyces aidingensis]SFC25688.1 two-component system, OmpR family, sensor histidine kinase MprB [Streptomyces aidingensis]